MLDFIKARRGKSPARLAPEMEKPVLTEEDEEFLHRIASEGTPPQLPARPGQSTGRPLDLAETGNPDGNEMQVAIFDSTQAPAHPSIDEAGLASSSTTAAVPASSVDPSTDAEKKSKWSWLRRDSRDAKRQATASGLMSAAKNLDSTEARGSEDHVLPDGEAAKEEEEMSQVLEQLHLAAVNNRVFSISTESQELLHKFTLILKDLVNGVPTAYGDLESLLTNSEDQIQKSYTHLPPWLQKIVEQLPSKMTKSIGPEVLAAAAEKHGMQSKYLNMAASGADKAGLKMRVPNLKDLITKPGAVAAMLKTIMNFLKLRFPAFLGLNVLYSLALFILLFVCWYCHKRGREVRLDKERNLIETQIEKMEGGSSSRTDLPEEAVQRGERHAGGEDRDRRDYEDDREHRGHRDHREHRSHREHRDDRDDSDHRSHRHHRS